MKHGEYIMKSAASFRKAYKLPEHKEKKLTVFLDAELLKKSDLPAEVINNAIAYANNDKYGLGRLNDFCMCDGVIALDDLKYHVDLQSRTYTIYNDHTGKPMYRVIQITSYRYAAYKANIYGVYNGLPVKSICHSDWRAWSYSHAHDLYYKEGVESNAVAAY